MPECWKFAPSGSCSACSCSSRNSVVVVVAVVVTAVVVLVIAASAIAMLATLAALFLPSNLDRNAQQKKTIFCVNATHFGGSMFVHVIVWRVVLMLKLPGQYEL